MVLLDNSNSHVSSTSHYTQTRPYYYTPPQSSSKVSIGRSMRTIRSTLYQTDYENSGPVYENLTDSFVDFNLNELAKKPPVNKSSSDEIDFLEISQTFSDFSACSSDISGELNRLANIPNLDPGRTSEPETEPEPCIGFLERETFSTEIIESIEPEDLQPTVKLCVDSLYSPSVAVKRSAAEKLRFLAKNRADNRALIGESGAISALLPLLRCSDPFTQEHSVTALLNLSLHEPNKTLITNSGAIKSLIYVLKTGTETSKQNAACALLSLALIDENKLSIGACGAIAPLVVLLINGTNRGKKDALTTLYKLCTVRLNKERAVSAGAVKPLVGLVCEEGTGLAEKAMVVLSSLTGIEMGKESIVEEGGIAALVEVIEDGSDKGKEFAVMTLLQLCIDSVRNRGLLVREGGIPPLVALSQTGTAKAQHKAETLLAYLREPRQEASTSTP
ncbi:U-box domain-containing protein 4-like isoform X1 [Lycium ferocissimum]|uniref:U-box domain-containing protein 4-like isoform X1 n=1 Tax=Lycium ferocissimum TaxID=112874 RepID=UPI0028165147|nr:U-box domain-containing protein 4-like isoform X1 [Lycium ferocissimum]